jgi:hypothetical protein
MLGMSFLRIYYVDRHIYVFLQMLFAGPFSGNAGAEKSKPGLPGCRLIRNRAYFSNRRLESFIDPAEHCWNAIDGGEHERSRPLFKRRPYKYRRRRWVKVGGADFCNRWLQNPHIRREGAHRCRRCGADEHYRWARVNPGNRSVGPGRPGRPISRQACGGWIGTGGLGGFKRPGLDERCSIPK